ncbi:MAG: cation diffusion facilitator family transporter, partial [Candidatus Omnitrophica bacterium]|nr:cation diffusion facilitator family transporter [Candidatus Omnitrophota bacterium]
RLTHLILNDSERKDINVRSAFLHMLADAVSSIGVVIAAAVIHYRGWLWVDPLISAVIALVILSWCWGLLKDSICVLLESYPQDIQPQEILRALKKNFNEVEDIHDIHIWEITSHMYMLTAHLVVDPSLKVSDCEVLRDRMCRFLESDFHVTHATFQFEGATRN